MPDGYKISCKDCQIHFYDEDVIVSRDPRNPEYMSPRISYEKWLDTPYDKASKYAISHVQETSPWDADNIRYFNVTCWVKCPLCGRYLSVWTYTYFFSNRTWDLEDYERPIKELIDDKYLVFVSKKDNDIEYLWGPEVAPPISEEIKKTIFDR